MERIKHFFGFMLLGVALWMVAPVLPAWATMLLLAALLLAGAVYLGAFERIEPGMTPRLAATKGAGLLLALMAALQVGRRRLGRPRGSAAFGALGGLAGGLCGKSGGRKE